MSDIVSDSGDVPDICLHFLEKSCETNNCRDYHASDSYLWQSYSKGKWYNMPSCHSKELENAYCDPNRHETDLSAVDGLSSTRFFPDDVKWYADFRNMHVHCGGNVYRIRRLSTVSNQICVHPFSTSYQWYFLHNHKWTSFPDESLPNVQEIYGTSGNIEKAFCKRGSKKLFDIVINQESYFINFEQMTRVNKNSLTSTPVCRRPLWIPPHLRNTTKFTKQSSEECSTSEKYEWFYNNGSGSWINFDDLSRTGSVDHVKSVSKELESLFKKNVKQIVRNIGSGKFSIDLEHMTITNLATSATRKIERRLCVNEREFDGFNKKSHNFDHSARVTDGTYSQSFTSNPLRRSYHNFSRSSSDSMKSANNFENSTIDSEKTEWLFQNDNKEWIRYDSYISSCLEKNFISNAKKQFEYKYKNAEFVFNFDRMTQTNKQTDYSRPIQRKIIDDGYTRNVKNEDYNNVRAHENHEWLFLDENQEWANYGDKLNHFFETKYASDSEQKVKFSIKGTTYYLDFSNSMQTNTKTKTSTPVMRRVSSNYLKSSQQTVSKSASGTRVSRAFDWYVLGDNNVWIKYSESIYENSKGILTTPAEDLEANFMGAPMALFVLELNNTKYSIDFRNMTQTNVQTLKKRKLCRVPKGSKPKPVQNQLGPYDKMKYEWEFLDEHGNWVKYGSTGSSQSNNEITTSSSDYIEKHYLLDSSETLDIQNNNNNYVLDFQNMTQTNKRTGVARKIRRVTVTNKSSIITYEWYFQDENNQWIRYGNSSNGSDHATTVTSDAIEASYIANPNGTLDIKSVKHKYTIDFKTMTQTNTSTNTVRNVSRKPAPSSSPQYTVQSPFEWYYLHNNTKWIKYSGPSQQKGSSGTLSDDIENQYSVVQSKTMDIVIGTDQFTLDFLNFTQTNKKTQTICMIYRRPTMVYTLPGTTYEWSFLDDNKKWIVYGNVSGTNDSGSATSVSSADIEKHFTQNPTGKYTVKSNNSTYELDFQNLTQKNTESNAVRAIRRVFLYLNNPIPSFWTTMNSNDVYIAVNLQSSDTEYKDIMKLVNKTVPNFNIISMKRIQNPELWTVYNTHVRHSKKRFPNTNFKEERLFHGTDSSLLPQIAGGNLDHRRYGESVGCLYGQGIYFSNSAKYSLNYGKGNPKALFVVKVIIGNTAKGDKTMKRPPNSCDTTVDDVANPSIFVKYDSKEYYPEYYIEYN